MSKGEITEEVNKQIEEATPVVHTPKQGGTMGFPGQGQEHRQAGGQPRRPDEGSRQDPEDQCFWCRRDRHRGLDGGGRLAGSAAAIRSTPGSPSTRSRRCRLPGGDQPVDARADAEGRRAERDGRGQDRPRRSAVAARSGASSASSSTRTERYAATVSQPRRNRRKQARLEVGRDSATASWVALRSKVSPAQRGPGSVRPRGGRAEGLLDRVGERASRTEAERSATLAPLAERLFAELRPAIRN